jgi:hypothetical protein
MYTWNEDTSEWYGTGKYNFRTAAAPLREDAAERAKAHGPRSYEKKAGPNEKITSPAKHIHSKSKNPIIVAIDVTGSMASWPAEIFDRLPLLYNTLSQYREDVEICFAAIGDAIVDRFPLQVTTFANGFDLEQLLGSLYGEGAGGDAPESYGLLAQWVNTHVETPNAEEPPFLIIFGDAPMHEHISGAEITHYLGDPDSQDVDALKAWQLTASKWNTWFLRRPTGKKGDGIDRQWAEAVGEQKIIHIQDEQRAVDYAMGLIARAWGYFGDFQVNMRARQSEDKVNQVSQLIELICPRCGAPIPVDSKGMFKCRYCGTTLKL